MIAGCRSRAHNDLYQDKMASEIRVLEDQLYDADYQNRVLRDKVWRLQRSQRDDEAKELARRQRLIDDPSDPSHTDPSDARR